MATISHYEVYADTGGGWLLLERFPMEQRSQAYQLAKEKESANCKVKIIKETYEFSDNSFVESVEYTSNLNRKGSKKTLSKIDYQKNSNEVVQDIADSRRNIYRAIIKFVVLIVISLIFANIFVSLIFPILDNITEEKDNSSLMFFIFFVVFLALAIPLVLKNIPWYIFMSQDKEEKEDIVEERFYDKAKTLVKAFNINADPKTMIAGSYPEATLEYKQYLIYYLSEILSNLNVRTALQKKFSRLGVKFLVFGGCLELARYGGLKLTEANSILLEAFKIIDGNNVNLEEFYETKQSYNDNTKAIYLTGVGAYLMHQVITDQKLYTKVLNAAFDRWESQVTDQKETEDTLKEKNTEKEPLIHISAPEDNTNIYIKSDLKFLDSAIPNQEEIASNTSNSIRTITAKLAQKFNGKNITEGFGVTCVGFYNPIEAIRFAKEYLHDISCCIDEDLNEKMILRTCCFVCPLSKNFDDVFINDVFEHIYNGEIVMMKETADNIDDEENSKEFLGDKLLKNTNSSIELYKLKY